MAEDAAQESGNEFADMDLAELMEVELISVTRTPRTIAQSPAAIYLITREDIKRSGHLTLPELLRGVPGLNVERINANQWAISARGFGGRFSDKLQVMIDGRIIYNSLFSGVFWGDQDLLLDDIERIEIVRGPGGATWGSNAVNGVINIITRSAREEHGAYYSIVSGTRERGQVELRQGGELSSDGSGWWRGFAKWTETEPSGPEPGFGESEFFDESRTGLVGFRVDQDLDGGDSLMVQGRFGHLRLNEVATFLDLMSFGPKRIKSQGSLNTGHLLARLDRKHSGSSGSSLLGYADVSAFNSTAIDYNTRYLTLDYHRYDEPWKSHVLTWGFGYRYAETSVDGGEQIFRTSHGQRNHILTSFLQDEWGLSEDWSMILGSRFELRTLGGFTIQPNARVLWSPSDSRRSAWAAVSRALRAPSYRDTDLSLPVGLAPGTPPILFTLVGNADFEAEELLAYELGYREQLRDNLSIDLTAFYFDYEKQNSFEPTTAPIVGGPLTLVNLLATNHGEGNAYGVEAAANYRPRADWRLSGSASWLEIDLPLGEGSVINETNLSDEEPRFLASLRSSHDLSESLNLDLALYGTGARGELERHLRGDLRLGWQIDESWNLSLALQDAFRPTHTEARTDFLTTVAEVERAAYLRLTWSPR